jgi:hypothetical protein
MQINETGGEGEPVDISEVSVGWHFVPHIHNRVARNSHVADFVESSLRVNDGAATKKGFDRCVEVTGACSRPLVS